jgi:tripartite-type tricarboxylate transporter receptor subunit TctC
LIDVAGRAVGNVMQRELGQPWLMDPRPGANAIVGAQAFLAAPADDHTLFLTATIHVVLPFVMKVPFDVIGDFEPVAMIGNSTSLVCVPAASPADSIAGFVAHARTNPGKLNYLNSGNGTVTHLMPELLKIKFGIDITSIYYKGLPPGVLDLLNGRLDIGVITAGLAMPHVKAGRLKAMAVVASQRLAELPDVATMAEQGAGDIEFRSLLPLYGPKGLPPPIVGRLSKAMATALADPSTKGRLEGAYIEPSPMTPAEVGAVMRAEHERLGALIHRLGIKPDGGS